MRVFLLFTFIISQSFAADFDHKETRFQASYQENQSEQVLRLKGSLITKNEKKLLGLLKKNIVQHLDMVIILDLFGGELSFVNKVYSLLKKKCNIGRQKTCHIETHIEMFRHCASACIPLFMLGDKRVAAERSKWGFHQASTLGGYVMIPFMSEYVLSSKGVNKRWLKNNKELFKTLKMSWFQPRELDGSSIITHIINHPL